MTTRDNLIAALNGEIPAQTPLSIYEWFFTHPQYQFEAWQPLFDDGLGLLISCQTVKLVEHGVQNTVEQKIKGDRCYTIYRKKTPVGTLQSVTLNSVSAPRQIEWHHEYWLKEPQDYRIQQWIVEHTEVLPQYDEFARAEERVGDIGVVVVEGGRTPAMSLMVDEAGEQRFALDIALEVDELFELYAAEKKLFRKVNQQIAAGPGCFIRWLENLTISMLGPQRYADLLMPVYRENVPMLEANEKRVMVHYDGQLNVIADQIARAPFHIIESLTEPPEGDMTFDICRANWPDKAFWANINLDLYALPPHELREAIVAKRERAGKKGVAFEISEDIPENWWESIPIVLETLQELG